MTRLAVPTTPSASFRARVGWGLIAGIGLAVLLAGVPAALAAAFGWPPPVPSGEALDYPHLHEADLALIVVAWAGWLVWAWLACSILMQLVRMVRWGMRPETLRDSASPARWLAGALIGTVASAIPATGAFAAAPVATTATTDLDTSADRIDDEQPARPLVWASPASTTTTPTATNQETGEDSVHTVLEGQQLWDLAGQYYNGDSGQYWRIWEANKGTVFEDGRTFTDPDSIWPGWELIIPGVSTPTEAAPEDDGFVHETVDPGETLSGYAEEYLGDETRYDEIADANEDRVQDDGRTLTDPDLIVDGWDIVIPVEPDPGTPPVSGPDAEAPEPGPAIPDDGNDGLATDPPHEETTSPEDSPTDIELDSDAATEPASDESGGDSIFGTVPFGVWLTGGTCLAAATVAALAVRLKRRRTDSGVTVEQPGSEAPWTGRLADLEAKIEAENRKFIAQVPDADPPSASTVAVSADRDPVDLRELAADGIGLLGPGQHGVARAAIIAAATANTDVRLTQAANLRLDLDAEYLPGQVRLVDGIAEAADEAPSDVEMLILCADTELDSRALASLEPFLSADGHGAIILGDWERAAVHVAGDGTIADTVGSVADLGMLHIADHDTATSLLRGLQDTATRPGPGDGEPSMRVQSEPQPHVGERAEDPPGLPAATRVDDLDEPEGEVTSGPAHDDRATAVLRLCLFGTTEVYIGEKPVVFKKGRRAKTFLAALALADAPISRGDLLEAVLPGYDDPVKARSNLNTIGSATRANLQQAAGIESSIYHWDKHTDQYELELGIFTTDRDAFDAAEQAAALSSNPDQAAEHLEEAARLYTGDLATELHTPEIDQLREQYRAAAVRALRKLADYHDGHSDTARAEHYRSRARALIPEPESP